MTAANAEKKPQVGIIMGSDTDLPVMLEAARMLDKFGIPYEVEVVSAHRSPGRTHEYATTAIARGLKCIIVAAGGAAHLAGVVAALTTLPVVAVPMATTVLNGVDSLLSTVQMPAGVPVATVSIGGGRNAGLLAVRILGAADPELRRKMEVFQSGLADTVRAKDATVRAQFAPGSGGEV